MEQTFNQRPCNGGNWPIVQGISVTVSDDHDKVENIRVWVDFRGVGSQVPNNPMNFDAPNYYGSVGPFDHSLIADEGGIVTVFVVAQDSAGARSELRGNDVNLLKCTVPI